MNEQTEEMEPEEPEEHLAYEWNMLAPFWAVMSKGTGEVILQVKFIRYENSEDNKREAEEMVGVFYGKCYIDVAGRVTIRMVEPVETKLDPAKEKNGTDSRTKGTD